MTFPPVHLTREGVSIVLTPSPSGVPVLAHLGAALGDLSADDLVAFARVRTPASPHSALDRPRHLGLVPENVTGFTGTPGLEVLRAGATTTWAPRLTGWTADREGDGVRLRGVDEEAGVAVEVAVELVDGGLLRMRTTVTNTGSTDLGVVAVRTVVPVGAHATELLDLTGRWTRERSPQRHAWVQGSFVRTGRHGRTGHDASLVLVAGTPGFGNGHGEVWGVHTAWSGDHTTYAERTPEGECVLGGGELLGPGEVVLAPGETYAAPWLLAAYAADGLDGLSARFHAWLRACSPRTRSERPVLINTWEAVYFDHELGPLEELAEAAAAVGVERFVLDDGWFRGRRSDRAGLGDWTVDPGMWPEGLHPLLAKVRALGMDFGLWVEPEMVNEDSDLAREHPDWLLRGRAALPEEWRFQQVLDLQVPAAYSHVRDALMALLDEYDIAFLKWDHNRDLIDVGHQGRPAVHGQTLAFYALLDELRAAHPGLEIESCASGGGRVDAEVLSRTDRIWPSDTIDALERQRIQRWTTLLVPPELVGSHLGGPTAHTTGRTHRLGLRAGTALLHHLGIEWDVSGLSDAERADVAAWIDLHKQIRPMIPTARLVHADHPDPAIVATGLVAPDRSDSWWVIAVTAGLATQSPTPLRFPGLDPDRSYRLTQRTPHGHQHTAVDLGAVAEGGAHGWWRDPDGVVLPGRVLASAGVRLPVLAPDSAWVVRLVTEG